jgi:predicted RNA binding protein YcfA (HicA-like mRNA interferase family)
MKDMVPHVVPIIVMTKAEKLKKKAKNSTGSLSFKQLCSLAEDVGFELIRQKGSHRFYYHHGIKKGLSFQPAKDGKSAKSYQLKQLKDTIDQNGL